MAQNVSITAVIENVVIGAAGEAGSAGAKRAAGAVGAGAKMSAGGGKKAARIAKKKPVTGMSGQGQRDFARRRGARTELPAGVTGLDTGLAHVKRDGFAHCEGGGG